MLVAAILANRPHTPDGRPVGKDKAYGIVLLPDAVRLQHLQRRLGWSAYRVEAIAAESIKEIAELGLADLAAGNQAELEAARAELAEIKAKARAHQKATDAALAAARDPIACLAACAPADLVKARLSLGALKPADLIASAQAILAARAADAAAAVAPSPQDQAKAQVADLRQVDGIGKANAQALIARGVTSRHRLATILRDPIGRAELEADQALKASAAELDRWLAQLDAQLGCLAADSDHPQD